MTLKLNRSGIFLIGIGLIILYLFLNRIDYIVGSNTTIGEVVRIKRWSGGSRGGGYYTAPLVKFSANSKEIVFQGATNMDVDYHDMVPVIYKINDPESAEIYNFIGFWFYPLLYSLLPLAIIGTAAFSFLTSSDILIFNIGKKFTVTKTTKK